MITKQECQVFLKLRKDARKFISAREKASIFPETESQYPSSVLLEDVKAKLGIERRKARSGAPDYDSNRHINLLRIVKSIESREAMPG